MQILCRVFPKFATVPLTLYIAFHAAAQAICAINIVVHLQNQLSTTLLLRVLSATKPQSSLLSAPQQFQVCPQTAEGTLTPKLHHCLPHSQWCALSNDCQLKTCIYIYA